MKNISKSMVLSVLSLMFTSGVFASSTTSSSSEKQRLCGVFQEKIAVYEQNMRTDAYAQKTLKSYENRAKLYCSK